MPFEFTQIAPNVTRCRHRGPITPEDSHQLRAHLKRMRGALLADLHDTPMMDSFREFLRVRAMLPRTAFYGPPDTRPICRTLPGKDFYMRQARHFTDETEALDWLTQGEEMPTEGAA